MTIDHEKVIAGLSCGDVLARLSEYLDGELSQTDRARLETHLRGCDGCARFGGELRATVHALRERLARPATLPREVTDRLSEALDEDSRLR